MINHDKEFGFSFDGLDGARSKFFNIDGSEAEHVNIWVEAFDDRRFWLAYIESNPSFKFSLKTPDEAQASDGKVATGCERLFSLERNGDIVLGKHNIFCLDSDDSFIKGCAPSYSCRKAPRDHIFFTNIYATENAILELDLLDETFKNVTGHELDHIKTPPSDLILTLSKSIFPAFIDACFFEAISNDSIASTTLRKHLTEEIKSLSNIAINEKFESSETYKDLTARINTIHEAIIKEIAALAKNEEFNIFTNNVNNHDINPENIFLFINGHLLFDTVTYIYQKFSDSLKKDEITRLKAVYPDSNQASRSIKNGWPKFSDSLKAGFLIKKPTIPFLCKTFERFQTEYQATQI